MFHQQLWEMLLEKQQTLLLTSHFNDGKVTHLFPGDEQHTRWWLRF
jgi:hypothetical protein